MTSGTPALSVVMQVYNAAPYIAEAIECILAQLRIDDAGDDARASRVVGRDTAGGSHSPALPSMLREARILPSGLNATLITSPP